MTNPDKQIAIIGGGPAGLMAAYQLCQQDGMQVHVFDQKPSVGRKFLIAGRGGLNLTNAEDLSRFMERYEEGAAFLSPHIKAFTPDQLREWATSLGIETFVGSSGRVFPKEMKATGLMRAWTKYLTAAGVQFHLSHKWQGLEADGSLKFTNKTDDAITFAADATLLSMGGASYAHLGASGEWAAHLKDHPVSIAPFAPINCGYETGWSDHILPKFEGMPLKNVAAHLNGRTGRGDMVITAYGLEGGALYAISPEITRDLGANESVTVHLDLRPDMTTGDITARLQNRGKASLSNHLRKKLKLSPLELALFYELTDKESLASPGSIARSLKSLPIAFTAARPMDRAISVMGGIDLEELGDDLMLRQMPGVFAAGEMLDWHAPTGGYLLQACFSTAVTAAEGIRNYLKS